MTRLLRQVACLMRPLGRAWLALAALTLLLAWAAPARAQDLTLSGRWSATAMSVNWRVGSWGEACGPRPGGGGAAGGTVSIQQLGSELAIHGGTRTYRTTECWEQFPGLAPRSHTGGRRGWRTTCKTAAGDPRQATVVTTLSATDDAISFDETGQYQFVIEGTACTASVRRTRSFKLIQREGAPSPAPSAAPTAPATPSAPLPSPKPQPPAARCTTPGPASRLEVRPEHKLIRPGGSFQFRASVLDAAGCTAQATPTWSLSKTSGVTLSNTGLVSVADDTAEGELQITASVGGRSVKVVLEVASAERYAALLAGGGFDESGERGEAIALIAGSEVGSAEVTSVAERERSWLMLVIAYGGLVGIFILGLGGLMMRRRQKPEPASAAPQPGATPGASASRRTICPTCGQIYEDGARYCGADQTQLVPLN
ncbi:MAG: hypothetical protein KIT72_03480 [Polyangiaceae bacterium]|nr:hypothetical protein [Polyangiaceae bacterium]